MPFKIREKIGAKTFEIGPNNIVPMLQNSPARFGELCLEKCEPIEKKIQSVSYSISFCHVPKVR